MRKWLSLLSALIVVVLGVLYWQNLHETDDVTLQTPLTQAINQCDLIAAKAAADLPEALPFQKLEKAARQSRVLERCMVDHGYQENPAWVTNIRPLVKRNAMEAHVSEDEAYETLRRAAMLKADKDAELSYWRPAH